MNEKELLAGLPAAKIKRILTLSFNDFINSCQVEKILGKPKNAAVKLMHQLEALGYVTYLPDIRAWTNTMQGDLLASQPLTRSINRSTVVRTINGLIKRIELANADPKIIDWINVAFVFGDILNKEMKSYDAIQVGLLIASREASQKEYDEKALILANESKKVSGNVGAWRTYPLDKLFADLKDSRHHLDLYLVKDAGEYKNDPHEVIYRRNV